MKLRLLLYVLVTVFNVTFTYSQVVINEFSSSNISRLPDEDGDFNDWIELYNNSPSAKDMKGYYLSDDLSNRKKWMFPSVSIKPWSYLFVYASGKERNAGPVNYKTVVSKNSEWKYLVPSSEPDKSWKDRGFDATGWKTGNAGFGYGDDDDSTVLDKITSVYIRKEFTLDNISEISEIVLSVDYDDGFVAYVNGREIARSNVGSSVTVPFSALAASSREAIMYSNGFPDNFIVPDASTFLYEGINVIAIQGHNNSSGSSDFSLIPILTIGRKASVIGDTVPEYIRLSGRKLHAGFKIDSEGEALILSSPDSSSADVIQPVRMAHDLSWGRKPDGGPAWVYFDIPTPSASNTGKGYTSMVIDTVIFSVKGGYYNTPFDLRLSSRLLSDSVFYTTDGSEPTTTSRLYIQPIRISDNSVVRAKSIKTGMMPGVTGTNTYYLKKHVFPVVCISTDPPNLWDFYTGIYVAGPNASATYPFRGANFWQDWEKRAHLELYTTGGEKSIDQDIGLKIFGGWSRGRDQKSFALMARKEYGKGSFSYSLFGDKDINEFESLVLRNGGNDWGKAMMRDGLTSMLVKDMNIDRTAIQPAIVYLNGVYWGILNFREKISNNYLAENHFVNANEVNLLEGNSKIIDGTNKSYTSIIEYLNSNTLETDEKYMQVMSKIDVDNYIQYQLTQIFVDNRDWPGNNIKYWSSTDPGSLWRWIIYDTDFGFSIFSETAYNFNTLAFALAPDSQTGANKPWATLLFRRMISNPGFRNEFANQYADRMNRNFSASRIHFVVDSLKQLYLPEINDHLARWNLSYDNWLKSIDNIRVFAANRHSFARSHLASALNLGSPTDIRIEIANPGTGRVQVNSIIPYSFPFTGTYFKDLPIKLTAVPAPGYRFSRWEMGSQISGSLAMTYNMAGSMKFRAVFLTAGSNDNNIVINEICYNSSADRDTEDWVEIFNAGKSTVNLKDWIVTDNGPESGFRIPENLILYPGMYTVICRDLSAFRKYWTVIKNSTGDMEFGLSSAGEKISLYDPDGYLVDFVDYKVISPWPEEVAEGSSIELKDPYSDNNAGENWKAVQLSTPGLANSSLSEKSNPEPPLTKSTITSFPNPFRDFTTFLAEIDTPGKYRIGIFNSMGYLINSIADKQLDSGSYYFEWDGTDNRGNPVAAGVYTVRMTGNKLAITSKVVLIR